MRYYRWNGHAYVPAPEPRKPTDRAFEEVDHMQGNEEGRRRAKAIETGRRAFEQQDVKAVYKQRYEASVKVASDTLTGVAEELAKQRAAVLKEYGGAQVGSRDSVYCTGRVDSYDALMKALTDMLGRLHE